MELVDIVDLVLPLLIFFSAENLTGVMFERCPTRKEFSHPDRFRFWLYPIHKRLFREPQRILFRSQFSATELNFSSTFSHFQHSHGRDICC